MIDINTCFGFYPWKNINASEESLLSILDNWNIKSALTLSLRGVFYDYRDGNIETLRICEKQEKLYPIATIDPRKALDYEKEVEAIAQQGFKTIRIFPEQQNWSVEQLPFRKLLKAIDALKIPLITSESPAKLYEYTSNISIPIVFISSHYYKLYETLAVFSDRPNFYAEARQMNSPDAVEIFVQRLGSNRLLFGTGIPFEYADSSIYRLQSSELGECEKIEIFQENAVRLFCLNTTKQKGDLSV